MKRRNKFLEWLSDNWPIFVIAIGIIILIMIGTQ